MSFEKGDIVEAVHDCSGNSGIYGFNIGDKFIVNDFNYCKGCKCTFLDIGLPYKNLNKVHAMCGCGYDDTGLILPSPTYQAEYFRKIGTIYRTVEIASEIKELITEVFEVPDKIIVK